MSSKPTSEAEAIRSDIEMTRRRMDDTVDALSQRLHGRHLLDEVIGFFRGSEDDSGTGARLREKVSQSAGTAANTVVDTIKKNPLPILLVTAGAAWLAYSATRGRKSEPDEEENYDPDADYEGQVEYPGGSMSRMGEPDEEPGDEAGSKLQHLKDKAASATGQVKEKLSDLSDRTRDAFESVRDRASDLTGRMQDRTRELYGRTRDRVARTADEHPLSLGLGCLAAGVLIGLALPTPKPVDRLAGPSVDRLRSRTRQAGRDMMQKGRRVMQAASDAAKHEAQAQGLTPEQLRQNVSGTPEHSANAGAEGAVRTAPVAATPSEAGPTQ